MAKRKGRRNKSKAVRELLMENPKMSARDVVAALAQRRMRVSPNLVYFQKGKLKGVRQRRQGVVRAARAAASMDGDPAFLIREVKALAAKSGGIEKLKDLVAALAE